MNKNAYSTICLGARRSAQMGINMRKRIAGVLTAAVLCLALSGCGSNQIPEMTGDQLQMIGEYAAITWMKYDAGNRSRLVELPPEPTPDPVQQEKPLPSDEPGQGEEPDQPEGMRPTEDTPVAGSTFSMEEVLGLPEGFRIAYQEHELCDVYPNDQEDSFFSVTAVEGKKLLVLRFSVYNGSGQEQQADMLSGETAFQIVVNETFSRRAMTTGLLDDLATFQSTIPADGSASAVLLIEVEDGTEISSVSLKLKNDSKTCTIQLF